MSTLWNTKTQSNGNKSKMYSYRGLKDSFFHQNLPLMSFKKSFQTAKNNLRVYCATSYFLHTNEILKAIKKNPSTMKN